MTLWRYAKWIDNNNADDNNIYGHVIKTNNINEYNHNNVNTKYNNANNLNNQITKSNNEMTTAIIEMSWNDTSYILVTLCIWTANKQNHFINHKPKPSSMLAFLMQT